MIIVKIDNEECSVKEHCKSYNEILQDIRSLDVVRCQLIDDFKKRMVNEISKDIPNMPIEQIKKVVEEQTEKELENIQLILKRVDFNE